MTETSIRVHFHPQMLPSSILRGVSHLGGNINAQFLSLQQVQRGSRRGRGLAPFGDVLKALTKDSQLQQRPPAAMLPAAAARALERRRRHQHAAVPPVPQDSRQGWMLIEM